MVNKKEIITALILEYYFILNRLFSLVKLLCDNNVLLINRSTFIGYDNNVQRKNTYGLWCANNAVDVASVSCRVRARRPVSYTHLDVYKRQHQ